MNYIKELAYLSIKSTYRWNIIFIPGLILSLITLIFGIITILPIIVNSISGDQVFLKLGGEVFVAMAEGSAHAATHVGGATFVMPTIAGIITVFAIPILIIGVSTYMIYKYYSIATAYTGRKALYDIWKSTLRDWFNAKMAYYLDFFVNKSEYLSHENNKLTNKMKLILAIKEDEQSSRFQKKLLLFVVNIIDLKNNNMYSPKLKFSDLMIEKIQSFMDFLINPSILFTYRWHVVHLWVIYSFIHLIY